MIDFGSGDFDFTIPGGGGGGIFGPVDTAPVQAPVVPNIPIDTDPFGGGSERGIVPGGGGVFGGSGPTPTTPGPLDTLSAGAKGFGDIAKSALPFVQLGTAGLGIGLGVKGAQQQAEATKIARDAEKRQEAISTTAQGAAQPLTAFSQQQLGQATQGKIDPAQEAIIQQWAQGAKQKVMDLFSRSGQGNSLQLQNELAWIDQMADGMRMQSITAEETTGIAASNAAAGMLGTGARAASGAGGQAQASGQNLQSLIAEANKALGTLAGAVA